MFLSKKWQASSLRIIEEMDTLPAIKSKGHSRELLCVQGMNKLLKVFLNEHC